MFSQQSLVAVRNAISCLPLDSVHSESQVQLVRVQRALCQFLLLWEVRSCAIQGNLAPVAGFQPAWCHVSQKDTVSLDTFPAVNAPRVYPSTLDSLFRCFPSLKCSDICCPSARCVALYLPRLLLSPLKHSDFAGPEDLTSNYLCTTSKLCLLISVFKLWGSSCRDEQNSDGWALNSWQSCRIFF